MLLAPMVVPAHVVRVLRGDVPCSGDSPAGGGWRKGCLRNNPNAWCVCCINIGCHFMSALWLLRRKWRRHSRRRQLHPACPVSENLIDNVAPLAVKGSLMDTDTWNHRAKHMHTQLRSTMALFGVSKAPVEAHIMSVEPAGVTFGLNDLVQ